MIEPRRVLIDWDYGAQGIWWVLTREKFLAPPPGRWTGTRPADRASRPRAWSEQLTGRLLDELQEWNDDWDRDHGDAPVLHERGRALAVRVQEELGAEDWDVLYKMNGRVHRVQPPGSWPCESWRQELLGYPPGAAARKTANRQDKPRFPGLDRGLIRNRRGIAGTVLPPRASHPRRSAASRPR